MVRSQVFTLEKVQSPDKAFDKEMIGVPPLQMVRSRIFTPENKGTMIKEHRQEEKSMAIASSIVKICCKQNDDSQAHIRLHPILFNPWRRQHLENSLNMSVEICRLSNLLTYQPPPGPW
jgi:hypothetical protein